MAIAIEQDQAVEQEQVIRADIRQLAAAATLCRKARPKFRHDIAAWRENVLVHGAYVYGGDPHETTVQAPHGGEYAHRAFAVPYDSITAAAKGRKGTVELRAGSITFDDGATFAWKDDAAKRRCDRWRNEGLPRRGGSAQASLRLWATAITRRSFPPRSASISVTPQSPRRSSCSPLTS